MELREFAERILFGETLEDKLVDPVTLTDAIPGAAIAVPDAPGRPPSLAFLRGKTRAKVPFPGVHELDKPRVRGQVLHFFANHELLAMELMALLLLRFPEAPESFRRGIAETIVEEQNHMRLYAERMRHAGVEFGEIPVNEYFWTCLRDVASPLEFVTGMSMTLEQANLDYAGYYRKAFRAIGDFDTADVLDIVYTEEIGHVRHGVVWFDRWRPPGSDRFETWLEHLPERLPPVRAKGLGFDEDSRLKAGLDRDYIRRLRVLGGSKGRPPNVYAFLPQTEAESAPNVGDTPSRIVSELSRDLETLPMFLAASDDVVLTTRSPDPAFLTSLGQLGFAIPEFVEGDSLEAAASGVDYDRIGEFVPWGWSRSAHRLSARLQRSRVADDPPIDDARMRVFHTKTHWTKLRESFLEWCDDDRLAPRHDRVSLQCTPEERAAFVERLGDRAVCVRGDFGTAGRENRRFFDRDELRTAWDGYVNDGYAGVIEPLRARVFDFSWQFELTRTGDVHHHGIVRSLVDRRGQYRGAILNRFAAGLPTDVVRFIHDDGVDTRWLRRRMEQVAERVAAELDDAGFRGLVGVDGYAFRDQGGALRVEPLAEVNPRVTMGRVAQCVAPPIAPATTIAWLLVSARRVEAVHGGRRGLMERLDRVAPRVLGPLRRGGQGLIRGAVFTTDPTRAQQVYSLMVVAESDPALLSMLRAVDPDLMTIAQGEGSSWPPEAWPR